MKGKEKGRKGVQTKTAGGSIRLRGVGTTVGRGVREMIVGRIGEKMEVKGKYGKWSKKDNSWKD